MMEKELGTLRQRAQQLKEKRPGYREILDFYVRVKEAQVASRASLKIDPVKLKKKCRGRPIGEGFSLIKKEDFPVDIDASISLFHTLCRIGKTANPHMAEQCEKINKLLDDNKMDLKKLLARGGTEQMSESVAADRGLNRQVLAFLIRNSIRPSIEAGLELLRSELDPETLQKIHCPVCGSLPSLNLLKGEGGKRYSLCSYCGYQWRIDRLSCAACGNKEQGSLKYFYGKREATCRMDLCDKCHHYTKTIDYRSLEASDPSLEDLATLHLDVVAIQKEYKRCAPNPWST